jgi:hypothetical protein
LKNEATDLIENKGSPAEEIRNEATVLGPHGGWLGGPEEGNIREAEDSGAAWRAKG